ncbi:putative cell division cycle 20.1, cofactor of APC complex-like isoform X1 [Capsicum annuum]|uniref:late embryogenesis abundant protein At5g17165 n=1 Tax=Capsicum annuum TaxID=4072 RepID=UPI0007BF9BF2|nr:late embryogenesis abundant protein At5g17165 [Capsicum annuum]KAF3639859.1 putative cell division cycle 20.1, cofactor of APC complex-like isoform X1 [Capsicum annuum]KAF3640491.1 putative cell division cycle 20.1, cofactor of APC complex-like isoform X1 [Capsicum annuum]
MAANLNKHGLVSLGKGFLSNICYTSARRSTNSSSISARRAVHASAYDKNPDEYVQSFVVPDEVIKAQSDKYWTPHPHTGVFGPANDHHIASRERGLSIRPESVGVDSVLEQKAFFRPLEDLEKPAYV